MPPRRDLPDFPEGNDVVVSKGPCPKCSTEYGFVTYADGHGHCFSCGITAGVPLTEAAQSRPAPKKITGLIEARPAVDIKSRELQAKTLARYGYFISEFKGQKGVHVAPYRKAGEVVCQKLRIPYKEFLVLKATPESPSITDCELFGQHVWGDGKDLRVVVTEGEIDAMSCAQATDFKFPCVSVSGGSKGAAKSLKANYLWLDRFGEIILWFDADKPGQDAIEECAPLFKVGKVKIARCMP